VKPFATLGSEISKVRERVRRGAESLRPAKVASDVRDQRDRLLAKLGEQTFRLIAERKLQVPKVLQESVEKLATLLGVQLPPQDRASTPEKRIDAASANASDPLYGSEPPDVDEPSIGDAREAVPLPRPPKPAAPAKKPERSKKGGAKRRTKR
jgi:hypothetical protein